tara:strand:- start:438 stop:845 length:408 start_codon:yes stop_codon:yes gene_type:complete
MKSLRPIFKKNVMSSIDGYSYIFLNTLFISLFFMIYFLYLQANDIQFSDVLGNCFNMNCLQLISMLLISFFTVLSTIFIMNQQEMSTAVATIMKSISTIIFVLIGIFLYREKYTLIQFYGVFLTIIGIFFISCGK